MAVDGITVKEEPTQAPVPPSTVKKRKRRKKGSRSQTSSVNVAAPQTPPQQSNVPPPVIYQPTVQQPGPSAPQPATPPRQQQQRKQRPSQNNPPAGNPAAGLVVSKTGWAMQFAPPINRTPITYGPPPAPIVGPRWACPVKGHAAAHEVGVCHEFWTAIDNKSRRELIWGNACILCLGTRQGCRQGECRNQASVPLDVVCPGCAVNTNGNRVPACVLVCGLNHARPAYQDYIRSLEAWIPNFQAGTFGVPISLYLSVEEIYTPSLKKEWGNDADVDSYLAAGKKETGVEYPTEDRWKWHDSPPQEDRSALVYDTIRGRVRPLHHRDPVIKTSPETPCYVMQVLCIAGTDVLVFYDNGANNNLIALQVAVEAGFRLLSKNTIRFNVAGGGYVDSDCGQYAAVLGPDTNGNYHDVECQGVETITTLSPKFDLEPLHEMASQAIGGRPTLPPSIGGSEVKMLIGIRSTQLAPRLLVTLPGGLCVYKSVFIDVWGSEYCFGGPHEIFTAAYEKARGGRSAGVAQVVFTEMAEAYLRGPRTFLTEGQCLELKPDKVEVTAVTTSAAPGRHPHDLDPIATKQGLVDEREIPDETLSAATSTLMEVVRVGVTRNRLVADHRVCPERVLEHSSSLHTLATLQVAQSAVLSTTAPLGVLLDDLPGGLMHDPDPSDKENPSTVKTRLKERRKKTLGYMLQRGSHHVVELLPETRVVRPRLVGWLTVAVGVEELRADTGGGTSEPSSALK